MQRFGWRPITLTISLLASLVSYICVPQAGGQSDPLQRPEGQFREGGFHLVTMADKQLWAIGLEGDALEGSEDFAILKSNDLGFSWTRKLATPGWHLDDIYFQDAQTGWVVGSDRDMAGVILHTTDGGETWNRQPSPAKRPLWRVRFINRARGWAVGWGGQILDTQDGGAHWRKQRLAYGRGDDAVKGEITGFGFADERNGWVVGEMGQIYQTTDGGETWRSRGPELSRRFKVDQPWRVNFREVHFFNKRLGYLIVEVNDQRAPDASPGSYLKKLLILQTQDGGRHWMIRGTLKTPTFVRAQFLSEDEWWLRTASLQTLFHTLDRGRTWSEVNVSGQVSGGPVFFIDSNTGWWFSFSSGFSGPNLLTHNRGKTWAAQKIKYPA